MNHKMKKELKVLPANLDHVDELNTLMRASKGKWGYDEKFLNKFMHIFKVTENCIRKGITKLVYLNEELIGFYSFLKHDIDLELDMFFIDPKYIGKGFGRKIWDLCLTTMHDLGYVSFYLIADPNANLFYEKMGCVKIGEKISEMGVNRINNIYRYCA